MFRKLILLQTIILLFAGCTENVKKASEISNDQTTSTESDRARPKQSQKTTQLSNTFIKLIEDEDYESAYDLLSETWSQDITIDNFIKISKEIKKKYGQPSECIESGVEFRKGKKNNKEYISHSTLFTCKLSGVKRATGLIRVSVEVNDLGEPLGILGFYHKFIQFQKFE